MTVDISVVQNGSYGEIVFSHLYIMLFDTVQNYSKTTQKCFPHKMHVKAIHFAFAFTVGPQPSNQNLCKGLHKA